MGALVQEAVWAFYDNENISEDHLMHKEGGELPSDLQEDSKGRQGSHSASSDAPVAGGPFVTRNRRWNYIYYTF